MLTKRERYRSVFFSHKTLEIIKVLYKSGVLSNFKIVTTANNKVLIKITVLYYKNIPFFQKINPVSTLSKKFFINYKTLKLIHTVFKSSLLILSTTLGVVTGKEALSLGVGGIIIYLIN